MDEISALKSRIKALEKELEQKDKDLVTYRKELVRANEQLENLIIHIHSQLKKALEIQRQVVPTEFPHIPGFEFSTKFIASSLTGGDYFDIFEHRDKMQFSLLLSSSSGYSLSALFLSIFMKFTFQARTESQSYSADNLLQALSKDFLPNIDEKDQFHCFYGVMNRRHLRLDYVNMGDVVAIHYSHATKNLKRLQFENPAVHRNSQILQFKIESLAFEPKDKLILCSPGLFKVASPGGEFFGEERYYSIIKKSAESDVHNLRNEVFFQAQQFMKSKNLPQDLTVIVVETKERVLKLA
jgi:sigma-B regulation protein RsbU (phosphoserine phosphatase)